MDQDRHPAEPVEQVEQHEARAPLLCRGERRLLGRKRTQARMIAKWMQSTPTVQAAAESGCIQTPNRKPVATTSSITT